MPKKLLLYALSFLLLCGCTLNPSDKASDEYLYSTRKIMYSEENAQYSFSMDADYTEAEFARYYFDPLIDIAKRESCIDATERILSKQPLNVIPEIYVFSEDRYNGVNIVENKLFITVREWQTIDYTANVLLTAYGGFSHFGLAFGYANLICGELQWGNSIEGQFTKPSIVDLCDLNLLCFDAPFSSEQDVTVTQQLACGFVSDYITEHGEDELQQLLSVSDTTEGMESVKAELKNYYRDNNLTYDPSTIRYGYGGVSFDYIVSDDLATFYLGSDWKDANSDHNPLVSDNFLHENYADTKAFYEINLQQMKQYQDLFALEDYNNDLSIVFSNSKSPSQSSFYQAVTHRIYVINIDSLMHEYIHALTQPKLSMDDWQTEGFARYFSYRHDYYGIAFLNQDYNNTPLSAATQYVHEYLDTIDRPIDMAIDYAEIENIAVYSRDYKNPNSGYVAGSSFVQYLVEQYGEKAVINSIYGDGTTLSKSYSELVAEWNSYIADTYSDYSKYST